MKKIAILFTVVLMAACNTEQGYVITIEMEELGGKTVTLNQRAGGRFVAIDSVELDSAGRGMMKGRVESQEMMYLIPRDARARITLFMDNAEYMVKGTLSETDITADKGVHLEWREYQDATSIFSDRMQDWGRAYSEAQQSGAGQDVIDSIVEGYNAVAVEMENFDSIWIHDNPASVISAFLVRSNAYSMDTTELGQWISVLDESLAENTYYTYLVKQLDKLRNVAIGKKYVDFELPDTAGNPVRLSDVAGNGVLLIDFWASWCGPCRRANPGVVEIYNEFHDRGFDILGVSLDRTREEWLQGIREDGLTWTHVSDLKFWNSEAAQLWAVSAIPHTVLLDADGTIVARNLEKEELKAKLEALL